MNANMTDPIVQHQTEFLKRGRGNGGSPTNFEAKANGGTLAPSMRMPKVPMIRVRDRQGGYDYAGSSMDRGSQGSPGKERSLSPGQRAEVEKRKRVQQQIADYREMKMKEERAKLEAERYKAEEQQKKLFEAAEKRRRYMDKYKEKL